MRSYSRHSILFLSQANQIVLKGIREAGVDTKGQSKPRKSEKNLGKRNRKAKKGDKGLQRKMKRKMRKNTKLLGNRKGKKKQNKSVRKGNRNSKKRSGINKTKGKKEMKQGTGEGKRRAMRNREKKKGRKITRQNGSIEDKKVRDYRFSLNQRRKAIRIKKIINFLAKKVNNSNSFFDEGTIFFKDCEAGKSVFDSLR